MDVMETMAMVNSLRGATVDSVGDDNLTSSIIDRSVTEIVDDTVTEVKNYAFYGCNALTKADFRNVVRLWPYAFSNCSALSSVNFPSATQINGYVFEKCNALVSVVLPSAENISTYAFYYCAALKTVDLPAATEIMRSTFEYSNVLKTLILRNTEVMCRLGAPSAFTGTPIASSKGYIYVPAALIDSYKAATNWSTYAAQFRALEDYTVDGTTTGALDSTKI